MYTVDDVAGTPTSKKVTLADFAASAPFTSRYAPLGYHTTPIAKATRTSGNLSLTNTTWGNLDTGLDLVLPAVSGDKVVVAISGLWDNTAGTPFAVIDAATLVSSSLVTWFGTGEPTTTTGFGISGWFGQSATAVGPTGESMPLTLASGDISGGNVTVRFRCRIGAAGTRILNASTTIPLSVSVKNLGQ